MLYFDFINPYIIYAFFVLLAAFTIYAIFNYKIFIDKHKKKILIIVSVLLIWTQLARYIGVIYRDGFDFTHNLPFFMCRLSVLVLLFYTLTGNKRVESFLFYWGATGLAGVIYPNGPIENIANLTETFYIDHFLLAVFPFFLIVYQGYRPSKRDMFMITLLMALLLYAFIPINYIFGSDYFYLSDQSIFGEVFPGVSSFVFATVHYLVVLCFFSIYYFWFRNRDYSIGLGDGNESRVI